MSDDILADDRELVTAGKLAKRWKISRTRVTQMVADGALVPDRFVRNGGSKQWLFEPGTVKPLARAAGRPSGDLAAWVKEREARKEARRQRSMVLQLDELYAVGNWPKYDALMARYEARFGPVSPAQVAPVIERPSEELESIEAGYAAGHLDYEEYAAALRAGGFAVPEKD